MVYLLTESLSTFIGGVCNHSALWPIDLYIALPITLRYCIGVGNPSYKSPIAFHRSWFTLDPSRETMTWHRKYGFQTETRLITDIHHFALDEEDLSATSGNYMYQFKACGIYAVDVTSKHILILRSEDKNAIAQVGTELKNLTGKEMLPVDIVYVSKDNITKGI